MVAFFWFFRGVVPADRFYYDEADYMFASSQGFRANYVDEQVIPFGQFVQKGFSEGMHEEHRGSLSEFIRKSEDVSFYRHFHGPLYFYWLTVIRQFTDQERVVRWATLIFIVGTAVVVFFGSTFFMGVHYWPACSVIFTLTLFSPTLINSGIQITPHNLFVLVSLLNLVMLVKFLSTNNTFYWFLSVIFLGLCLVTIEYALVNLAVMAFCLVWQRQTLFNGWKKQQLLFFLVRSFGLWLLVTLVLWPGGIFKLTILKNYLFHFYYATIREYSSNSFLHLWWTRFRESPLEISFIAIFLTYYWSRFFSKRQVNLHLLPLVIYSTVIFLYTIKNRSLNQTYIASMLPPLFMVAGITFAGWLNNSIFRNKSKYSFLVGVNLIILVNFIIFYPIPYEKERKMINNAVVDFFQANNYQEKRLLIYWKYVPTFNYYFKSIPTERYENDDERLLSIINKGKYTGILHEGETKSFLQKITEMNIFERADNLGLIENDQVSFILFRGTS